MINIAFATSSRSDFGIMKNLCIKLNQHKKINFKLVVTGSHLDRNLGYSISEIKELVNINKDIIPIKSISNSKKSTVKYMSEVKEKFFNYFTSKKIDFLIILGDRFEVFAITQIAYILNIPIIHFHGGEVTNNIMDEAFRHSITKMSKYHFVSTKTYEKRVIQLGENPKRVFNVGSLGVENIKLEKFLNKKSLEKKLKLKFLKNNILISYHIETNDIDKSIRNFDKLMKYITPLKNTLLILTYPNNDPGYNKLIDLINRYKKISKNLVVFKNLGSYLFYNLLRNVDCIIGNSSSGIIEAPSLNTYSINLGKRQDGRVKAISTIDIPVRKKEIAKTLKNVFKDYLKIAKKKNLNPYEKKNSSDNVIKKILKFEKTSNKFFFNL